MSTVIMHGYLYTYIRDIKKDMYTYIRDIKKDMYTFIMDTKKDMCYLIINIKIKSTHRTQYATI